MLTFHPLAIVCIYAFELLTHFIHVELARINLKLMKNLKKIKIFW